MIMNNYDIDIFFQYRYLEEYKNLDENIINNILNLFNSNYDIKQKKNKKVFIKKSENNILKNSKLQSMKDKIVNKVNLILNKLSDTNIDNLVIEFIQNIKLNNIDDYNEFLQSIYNKIISEVNFIKNYLSFFKIITYIYEKCYNYTTAFFFDIIENKFKENYSSIELLEDDENKRLNNLILIKELININLLNNTIIENINEIIINQTNYYSDIYYWFKDIKLTEDYQEKIKNICNFNIQNRDKILLENLINTTSKLEIKIKKNTNIIEKLIEDNNIATIETYITNNCVDAISKNKFCESVIYIYIMDSSNDTKKIFNLFKTLIKNHILFKSNLSRGLIGFLSSNKLFENNNKLKQLLNFLQMNGITKGLEQIMNKNNIEII